MGDWCDVTDDETNSKPAGNDDNRKEGNLGKTQSSMKGRGGSRNNSRRNQGVGLQNNNRNNALQVSKTPLTIDMSKMMVTALGNVIPIPAQKPTVTNVTSQQQPKVSALGNPLSKVSALGNTLPNVSALGNPTPNVSALGNPLPMTNENEKLINDLKSQVTSLQNQLKEVRLDLTIKNARLETAQAEIESLRQMLYQSQQTNIYNRKPDHGEQDDNDQVENVSWILSVTQKKS